MMQANDEIARGGRTLVADLLARPDSFSRYNDLLSLFFRGLPLATLDQLLRHPNERVIAGALFIAEELGSSAAPLLGQMAARARHGNPRIRMSAYDALCNCVPQDNPKEFINVALGVGDPDPHCRKIAMLWMMRVPSGWIQAAHNAAEIMGSNPDIQEGLKMLGESLDDATQIRAWILDDRPLARKFGLIAAGRTADSHADLLELASRSDDTELRACAAAQVQFRTLRRRGGKR
jgi:hypothetical protein